MSADPLTVRVELPSAVTMKMDRAPVRFVLSNCRNMAFAVGVGFSSGVLAVGCAFIGIAKILSMIVNALGMAGRL